MLYFVRVIFLALVTVYYFTLMLHLSGIVTIYKHSMLDLWALLVPFYCWRKKFFLHKKK